MYDIIAHIVTPTAMQYGCNYIFSEIISRRVMCACECGSHGFGTVMYSMCVHVYTSGKLVYRKFSGHSYSFSFVMFFDFFFFNYQLWLLIPNLFY